ncbi:MAG: hypothetical protein Q9217_004794 [Psora testacea]
MPHKHRRDRSKPDSSYYNLPPNKVAHPFAIAIPGNTVSEPKNRKKHHKEPQSEDDTPRAFTRLLAAYRPPRSGQDDGTRPSKKRKLAPSAPARRATQEAPAQIPKIQPNEPLSYFAARVDAALPFSHLPKSKAPDDQEMKDLAKGRKTKTEKKMQRMQREWREQEQRRKEEVEGIGRREVGEGGVDESGVEEMGVDEGEGGGVRKKGRKEKRKRDGERDEEDPWAHIKTKRQDDVMNGGGGRGGLVGLHEVVQAPPRFKKREGGLKRQTELSEARRRVVQGYRAMMRQKRGDGRTKAAG